MEKSPGPLLNATPIRTSNAAPPARSQQPYFHTYLVRLPRLKILVALAALMVSAIRAQAGLDTPFEEPVDVMRVYAKQGEPTSQFHLALLLMQGTGVPKDPVEALSWYRKAAAAGLPEAEYNLAIALSIGPTAAKDSKEIISLLTSAAKQGLFEAQRSLILGYATGFGVPRNPQAALRWDFLARRTMALRYEKDVGNPPKPAKLLPDGFAEYLSPTGGREALAPDGSVAHYNRDGSRTVDLRSGGTLSISADGARRTTTRPDGGTLVELADGTRIATDPAGNVDTRHPDGSRTVEANGESLHNEPTRITTKFDPNGQLISKRYFSDGKFITLFPDRSREVEDAGEDDQGRKVQIIERYTSDGQAQTRRIVREDGVERTGGEVWTIRRWGRLPDGEEARVSIDYGAGVMASEPKLLEKRQDSVGPAEKLQAESKFRPATGADLAGVVAIPTHPPAPPPPNFTSYDPTANALVGVYRGSADIEKQLAELERIERLGRYFVGATMADYDAARSETQHFLIEIEAKPQKDDTDATWLNGPPAALPPTLPLKPQANDRSSTYPLGLNGRVAIQMQKWIHAETDHFVVHYVVKEDAALALRYLECAYFAVTQTLHLDPRTAPRKMHVFIFPDAESWKIFKLKQSLPMVIAGFAYKDELLLTSPYEQETYTKLLCHEATHAIVSHFYNGRHWPLWLNEGFAEYMGSKSLALRSKTSISRYLNKSTPGIVSFDQVYNRVRYGTPGVDPAAPVFYGAAERCVSVLLEKLPPASFPRFVNLAAAGNNTAASLEGCYHDKCPTPAAFQSLLDVK